MRELPVALLMTGVVVSSLACDVSPSSGDCSVAALESSFHDHDSQWNIIHQRLRQDERVPWLEDQVGIPGLNLWLSQDDSMMEGLIQLGVESVFRFDISGRPVLFLEMCQDADDRVSEGYAFRLDSSAGAQDPLGPQIDDASALTPASRFGFRHLIGGMYLYWMKHGALDA